MRKLFTALILTFIGIDSLATTKLSATGIPIDNAWKEQAYDFALKNVVHPSWGISHSERDYQLTRKIAKLERIVVDEDVLFASAFLHDIGGINPFYIEGVDHVVRSVEVIEPLLQRWGFPMMKWPEVKEMILGHTYYGPKPTSVQARAFRDADVLDFLGNIGIARILAVTEEPGRASPILKPSIETLKDFAQTMASNCMLETCKHLAVPRQKELIRFLRAVDLQSFSGRAL